MADDIYLTMMGQGPKKIVHAEHWSCPDAETYITGIDYYEHPKQCREKLLELYPKLRGWMKAPAEDKPIPRPTLDLKNESVRTDEQGRPHVRWGAGETTHWEWGAHFKTLEDVLAYSPIENADMRNMEVICKHDYTSEDALYRQFRAMLPAEWGDKAPAGNSDAGIGFYNTLFMWPILTFGWERFLEACLLDEFTRVMDEFAEISRRVFRAMARLPVHSVACHDDIVSTRGPICSPAWMQKNIFPRYEEYWSTLKAAGKEVIFIADGCMDRYADDVLACGARGIITEPYTDFKAIARRHKDCVLAGEGDNRILMRNRPEEIRAMVNSMVNTGRMSRGYFMCIGNHIPWDMPPSAVKLYLDLSAEMAMR